MVESVICEAQPMELMLGLYEFTAYNLLWTGFKSMASDRKSADKHEDRDNDQSLFVWREERRTYIGLLVSKKGAEGTKGDRERKSAL